MAHAIVRKTRPSRSGFSHADVARNTLEISAMKTPVLTGLLVSLISISSALAGPVMAPVVHKTGTVTASAPADGAATPQVGHALPMKTSLKIGAASEIAFDPFPGSTVLVTEKSEASIEQMEFDRDGERVRKRAATLRLDAGRLFYSVEKFKPDVTQFKVITPDRVVAARAKVTKPGGADLAGMVEIAGNSLRVTVLTGSAEVSSADGKSVVVDEGSLLTAAPAGARLVNLVTGKETIFDVLGNVTETRTASADELLAGRAGFQTALGVAEQAIATASLSGGMIAAISQTLVQLNRALAADGLDALTTVAVGSTTTAAKSGQAPLYAPFGMDGAQTVNPANISGVVRSGER